MALKVFSSLKKVQKAFAPFIKHSVIPSSSSSSSSSVSANSTKSLVEEKIHVQVEPKVAQKKLTLEEKNKLFEELLIEATYHRSLKFICTVCESIDEYLAKLNVQLIERGFDLGEATARRKSRVLLCHFVSREEIKFANQLEEIQREIEFYRQQKTVFEDLCQTRIQYIEFVHQLRQKRQLACVAQQ